MERVVRVWRRVERRAKMAPKTNLGTEGEEKGRGVRFRCVASEVWNMSGMEAEASLDPRSVWHSVVSEACASGGVPFGRNVHANFPNKSPVAAIRINWQT